MLSRLEENRLTTKPYSITIYLSLLYVSNNVPDWVLAPITSIFLLSPLKGGGEFQCFAASEAFCVTSFGMDSTLPQTLGGSVFVWAPYPTAQSCLTILSGLCYCRPSLRLEIGGTHVYSYHDGQSVCCWCWSSLLLSSAGTPYAKRVVTAGDCRGGKAGELVSW